MLLKLPFLTLHGTFSYKRLFIGLFVITNYRPLSLSLSLPDRHACIQTDTQSYLRSDPKNTGTYVRSGHVASTRVVVFVVVVVVVDCCGGRKCSMVAGTRAAVVLVGVLVHYLLHY